MKEGEKKVDREEGGEGKVRQRGLVEAPLEERIAGGRKKRSLKNGKGGRVWSGGSWRVEVRKRRR